MSRFSARHYRLVSPPAETPEQVRERLARQIALDRGRADREREYPVITPANAAEALLFQEERIQWHTRAALAMAEGR